jgi:gliding motility-associated-like protein
MRYLALLSIIIITTISGRIYAQHVDHAHGAYKMLENKGQWPDGVNYMADVPGGHIWFENAGILYEFLEYPEGAHTDIETIPSDNPEVKHELVYAEFVGANTSCDKKQFYPTREYYNFFLGNNESKWASDVRGYGRIEYLNLYDDIDLVFFEKEQDLKYEYRVRPNGNYEDIQIKYKGQDKIKKQKNGNLIIYTSLGQIIEQKPYVYQIINGKIVEIESEFAISESSVISFSLGDYDKDIELVIDPILVFATYSGSPTDNFGMTATYAYDGKAYSAGITFGSSYPTPGPAWNTTSTIPELNAQANAAVVYGVTDVFVSKYSADGTQMLWTCFLGGGTNLDGTETVHSLICDTSNNIYLYGATSSLDFPLVNEYQSTHAGGIANANFYGNAVYFLGNGTDIWVSKLSEDGLNLMGSTYIGGDGNDGLNNNVAQNNDSLTTNYGDQFRGEIMLDSMNNVIIASSTNSSNFPTANSFQSTPLGGQDGVVFKLSSDFSTLLWSSYYGGTNSDACYSVKLDSSYNVIIAGGTSSTDLPSTAGALTTTYQGGKTDGYVAKISPDGSTLVRTSYLGTSDYDQVYFIETDRWDNVYLYGQSNGVMPIVNAPYSSPNSGQFITKLVPDLSAIDYSTNFGSGSGVFDISPAAFLVDVCGNVYCTGWSGITGPAMSGMPITIADAFQTTPPSGNDFYLFVLERDAQSILYGTYIGDAGAGEHVDGGTSRFDKFGVVYQSVCGGCGNSSGFPTTAGAWSDTNESSNCNNLVFKFDFEIVPQADFEISDIEGCAPFTFILDNESNDTVNSVWTFPPEAIILQGGINPEIMFNDPGQYEIIISITDTICNLQDTAVKIINVYDPLYLDVSNDTIVCDIAGVDIWANSYGSGTSFIWYDDGLDSAITVTPTTTTTYYVHASNGWPLCDLIDSVTVITADGAMDLIDTDAMCLGDTLIFTAHNLLPSETITYVWSPPTGVIIADDSTIWVSPPSSMYYYVTGTTSSGCVFVDSVWVDVTTLPQSSVYATATPDTIPEGGSSVLEAFPDIAGYTYNWLPPTGLSSTTGQTVTASGIQEQTTYLVEVAGNGCTRATFVTITTVEFICGDVYIFVPSAFSPNGDTENDVLFVRGQNLEEIVFKVFDRWGELVFETNDQAVGWDGTFKGELVDPDVYVYHLTAICFDGQETLIKGNVTVLR